MRYGEDQETGVSQVLTSDTQLSNALPLCHLKSEEFIPGYMGCIRVPLHCLPAWNSIPVLLLLKNSCSTPMPDLPRQPKCSHSSQSTFPVLRGHSSQWNDDGEGPVGKAGAEEAGAFRGTRSKRKSMVPWAQRQCLEWETKSALVQGVAQDWQELQSEVNGQVDGEPQKAEKNSKWEQTGAWICGGAGYTGLVTRLSGWSPV